MTLVGGLAGGRIDAMGVAGTVAAGLGGAAGGVVAAAKFPYVPNAISLRPLLHLILTGALAGAALAPVFVLGIVLAGNAVALGVILVATVVVFAWLSQAIVTVGTRHPTFA